ncbi:hypothetical protein ACRXCV_07495 [Halobacteriovorax sp. GFR7]|uniref:hypothetical protein n=1 Tax=unclassified Halobacteriovorax TaxID=2639665 RepID=UPI003D96AF36
MKKIITKALVVATICSTVVASSCSEQYQADITAYNNNKLVKSLRKNTSAYHAVTAIGLYMIGVPAFPAYFALPLVGLALTSQQKKLKGYVQFFNSAESQQKQAAQLQTKLAKKGVDVSTEEIINELVMLNETGALCDGSIFYTMTGGHRNDNRKRKAVKAPSQYQVLKYLKKTL